MRAAVHHLLDNEVEAIAVSLLFSFLNPAHEHRIGAYIAEVAPHISVSLSSDVDPAFREYERTVVTTFDAYVKPRVGRYLGAMERDLRVAGVAGRLQVIQSRGGLASAAVAGERPVRLFLSGPAAGVLGALAVGTASQFDNLITIDVGGTSSDIALVEAGRAPVRGDMNIDGYGVRVPTVDVTSLGAGGGSIAWTDSAGGLRVGPHSAGAEPGPACYGLGGSEPTVTDASLLLGFLDPDYFAGGTLKVDRAVAEAAIAERIAAPLGMSSVEAALGIHRVVNSQMADGIRLVSLKRGFDPREFVLVTLGGGGGMHAAELAHELGIDTVLVPQFPGVLSAAGLLTAPIEHEKSCAFHADLTTASFEAMHVAYGDLDRRISELMAAERIDGLAYARRHSTDMAYVGQSHTIEVDFDAASPDPLAALYSGFEAAHERINGHATGAPAKIVNLRAVHQAHQPVVEFAVATPVEPGGALKSTRTIHLPGHASGIAAHVYDRARLAVDEVIVGPAVVEQADTTTLIPPGWTGRVLLGGAMLVERMRQP